MRYYTVEAKVFPDHNNLGARIDYQVLKWLNENLPLSELKSLVYPRWSATGVQFCRDAAYVKVQFLNEKDAVYFKMVWA